jgi:hypothetical protein
MTRLSLASFLRPFRSHRSWCDRPSFRPSCLIPQHQSSVCLQRPYRFLSSILFDGYICQLETCRPAKSMPSGPKGRPGASLLVYGTAAKSPSPADTSHAYTQSRRRVVRRHGIGPRLAHIWPMLSTCKGFKSPDPTTPKPRNTTTFTLPSGILRNTVPQVIHTTLLHFQHSPTSAFSQRLRQHIQRCANNPKTPTATFDSPGG